MIRRAFIALCLSYIFMGYAFKIKLSQGRIKEIGNKIWRNECAGTQEGLTHWGDEDFASLGIGHWTWFPQKRSDRFVEGFPLLIDFYIKRKQAIPAWLLTEDKKLIPCPWNTREEFLADFQGDRMRELRSFLYETVSVQCLCLIERLKDWVRHKRLQEYDHKRRTALMRQFHKLVSTPHGVYVAIDYINFKGEGLDAPEEYSGQKWGFVQVLEAMPKTTTVTTVLNEFAAAAKQVLTLRVKNAFPERDESQWLPGWYKRIDTYVPNLASVS